VNATGGTICLGAGVYDLGDGVRIVSGRPFAAQSAGPGGRATILVARGTGSRSKQSIADTVENIAIVSGAAAPAASATPQASSPPRLQDLAVLSYPSEAAAPGSSSPVSGLLIALRRNLAP
jgi:hypothetical protein